MATTLRGNSVGRDKKGTSPSPSLIKKPTKPLSQTPPSSSSSTTEDIKPVPSYLKTPKKAGLDLTKRSSSDLPQKTVINRRRSFDRPPPVSHVQKVIRNVPVAREAKPNRSTSFSHKQSASSIATPSTRPASDKTYARTTSALKDGRIDMNLSKPRSIIKKGTLSSSVTPMTKRGAQKKAPKSMSSDSSIEQLVIEDDLVNMDNFEVQSLPDMSEMPDINQELGDPTITFTEHIEQPVMDVHDNVDLFVEKTIDTFVHNEIETQPEAQNLEEQILTAECNGTDSNNTHNVENLTEFVEEKKEEEAFEQEIEKNVEEIVVKDETPIVITPAAYPEPVNVKKALSIFGKKEKQDYNDVIEETATKLMGGRRKNKVLALAGAFETVISLQDASKN